VTPSRFILLAALMPATVFAYPSVDRGALEGGASNSDLAISSDGRYIAASQRSVEAGLALWDRIAPSELPTIASVCEGTSVVWTTHITRGDAFYVGCGTNEVVRVEVDDSVVPPDVIVREGIEVGNENDTIVSLAWTSGDAVVHALTTGDGNVSLHSIDLATDAVNDFGGLPATVLGSGVDLSVGPLSGSGNVIGIQTDGTLLWASRSDSYLAAEAAVITGTPVGITVDPDGGSDRYLVAMSSGEVWSGDVDAPGALPLEFLTGLSSPQAIAFGPGTTTPVVYIANAAGDLAIYDTNANELEVVTLDSSGSPVAIAPAPDHLDTVYVASGDGTIRVVTSRPWITNIDVEPRSVGTGDDFTLNFTVDSDCDWDVRIGSGIDTEAGTSLENGAAAAGEEVTLSFDSGALTTEGENRLIIFATNADATGVDSTVVTLDTPPDTVSDFTVSPGDARLVLNWTSTSEEDISSYRIYLAENVFTEDDEELPTLVIEGADGDITYPLEVSAGDPLSGHSAEITELDNGLTYWVAVQPIDASGNIGPMSPVLSSAPEQTCGLVECYGDRGCSCSSTGSHPGLLSFALMALALLGVRRRT